jgi:hypothetical protein
VISRGRKSCNELCNEVHYKVHYIIWIQDLHTTKAIQASSLLSNVFKKGTDSSNHLLSGGVCFFTTVLQSPG